MALVGTLRDKMTKWVVGFIALAISAFVLNDLLGSGNVSIFGGDRNSVGEIEGTDIALKEYQIAIQEQENNYILSSGRSPSESDRLSIREQAWNKIIERYTLVPQYEKLSVRVTGDETWDLVQGKNMNEVVKQSFADSTGNFNRNNLISYLQQLESQALNSEPRLRWNLFKNDLTSLRQQTKFENLILKTGYITQAESEQEYHLQNDIVEVEYLYVPFYALHDSLVTISKTILEDYYEKTKKKYEVSHTRDMNYVLFPIISSANDSIAIQDELHSITGNFKAAKEDSLFASFHSDNANVFSTYSPASLPPFLANQIESLYVGNLIGPFLEGNSYKLVKVHAVDLDTLFNARASHILIRSSDETATSKNEAKAKASRILNDIKAGADFALKAKEFGTDGTASKGGDLGWFSTGQMVKPFQNAVFNAKKEGLIPYIVETQFGYHIIEVTHVKNNVSYKLATIEKEIIPGDDTYNAAYRKAETFRNGLSGVEEFKTKTDLDSITLYEAEEVVPNATKVQDIENARQPVLWLFRDAKKGKVSEVFDLEKYYMVAVMTGETEEGYASLDKIKSELTSLAKNEKKADMIIEQLSELTGTLKEIATAYGSGAIIGSSNDLKLTSNSLPQVGLDPIAVGKAFALEKNKRSAPFKGENGVLIMEMKNKTTAPDIGDYSLYENQLIKALNNRARPAIIQTLKEEAEIVDTRYLFY